MKRKLLALTAALCIAGAAGAQTTNVGIGTISPHVSAQLDVSATDRGFLAPRIGLTGTDDVTTIATPATGLMVYNTTAAGSGATAVLPGYYYFNGTQWVKFTGTPVSTGDGNIYINDGTLTGNRTVTQAGNTLSFTGGKVGIGTITPTQRLEVGGQVVIDTALSATPSDSVLFRRANGLVVQMSLDSLRKLLNPTGAVATLSCGFATSTGSFINGTSSNGTLSIPYSGGNGGSYSAISVASNGVTGLTATAPGGSVSNGSGSLTFTITGTPVGSGTASFPITFGGQSCTGTITVQNNGAVSTLNCAGATISGTLTGGFNAGGNTITLPYTGGNGGAYPAISISSSGVSGLTASAPAGNVNNGSGNLLLAVTGVPANGGTATFNINFAGNSCQMSFTVAPGGSSISGLNCAGATYGGSFTANTSNNNTITVPYSGGNGGTYNGQTIASTGVTGLTAVLPAGNVSSGSGNFVFTVTGTPTTTGTANFAFSIGGQSCTFTANVVTPTATISSLNCAGAVTSGAVVPNVSTSGRTVSIPYSGGNGVSYSAGAGINSTGVTGLTATLAAGTLAVGSGNLVFNLSGTATTTGTASFAVTFGGQSCTFTVTITDAVRNAIIAGGGSSTSAYDAAPANSWVKVTAAEYAALSSAISGASTDGTSNANFIGSSAFPANNTTTMNFNADVQVPASNYVVALSFMSTTTTAAIKLKLGTAQTSGYAQYGPLLAMSGLPSGGTRVYFMLKTPSSTSPASNTNLGLYDGANSSFGYRYVGGGVSRYVGSGDISNPNFFTSTDYVPMQVIATAVKQW